MPTINFNDLFELINNFGLIIMYDTRDDKIKKSIKWFTDANKKVSNTKYKIHPHLLYIFLYEDKSPNILLKHKTI